MKIFLSFSGSKSKDVALALREWIPTILSNASPWIADSDIAPGGVWRNELEKGLAEANFCIVCVTHAALLSPWVLFEAGFLLGGVKIPVIPYLIDAPRGHTLGGPLEALQSVTADQEGTMTLINYLNRQLVSPIPEEALIRTFREKWGMLKRKLNTLGVVNGIPLKLNRMAAELSKDICAGLAISNILFHKRIHKELHNFMAESGRWQQGKMLISESRGVAFLAELYEDAQKSIFSTSVKNFFSSMISKADAGKLLTAQQKSRAASVRVFLFFDRSEVCQEDMAIMAENAKRGVKVLVFFEGENTYEFPRSAVRDFTIIDDGRAVGVTTILGPRHGGANWNFSQKAECEMYMDIRKRLLKLSIPYEQI